MCQQGATWSPPRRSNKTICFSWNRLEKTYDEAMEWGLVFEEAGTWATGFLGLSSRRGKPQVAQGILGR